MKKFVTLMMALVVSVMAFAQEGNRDGNGNFVYGPYEANRFIDNWFVEVGGGANMPVDNFRQIFKGGLTYDFGGLTVNANLGKWFDPVYGVRLGWQGLTTGNIDNRVNGIGGSFDGNHYFNYVHGDFMVNVSNLFAGYKERRAVNVVPYLTAGAEFGHGARALAVGGGLELPVRVSNVVAIVPQFQVLASNGNVIGGNGVVLLPSASVNIRVNLGRNNFRRSATIANGYIAEIASLKADLTNANAHANDAANRANTLQNEVDSLKKAASEPKCTDIPNVSYVDDLGVSNFVLFFDLGKSTLSAKELEHLDFYAKNIISNSKKVKFYVTGATDSKTGSARRNEQLRKARAEYVCDLLAEKYGLGGHIEEVEGGFIDYVDVPELSRAVVISVEK